MNCFLFRSCYLPWEPNLMLCLLLLLLHFVLDENLYGAINLRDLCLLVAWHLNLSILESQYLLGVDVFFLISETSYRLSGISKLCTTQADISVQPDKDVELISNDTVAKSILCDFDRALVTLSFFCFPVRFNLCATSFLSKVVSEPQSNKALVFIKICPFDSFTGIICRKVCFSPSCVFTNFSLCWDDSGVWSFSPIVVC